MSALRRELCLAVHILVVFAALMPAAQSDRERQLPSSTQQDRLLAAVQQYADQYVSKLPNFLCVQTVRQFEASGRSNHWHKADTLAFRLAFNHGREDHSLERVNDKAIRRGQMGWRTPLITEGEFGLLVSRVFAEESHASFSWSGWEMLRGKEVAVFDYSVAKEHSSLKLTLSDVAQAIVPFYGSVYADPGNGAIRRITSTASDIPPEVRTKRISTTIDYEEVPIGSQPYLLPVRADVQLTTPSGRVRNEIQFDGYRKFAADSTITYNSDTASDAVQNAERTIRLPRPPEPH